MSQNKIIHRLIFRPPSIVTVEQGPDYRNSSTTQRPIPRAPLVTAFPFS
ncbi:MAG: hypothetical protein PUD47_00345 [Bacteroidales bacterium]|nr:hypothetical protein [Bacteroidales bacterium]